MEFTIHNQVLTAVFVIAIVMGGVANKTNFCTMGAVSDWVNMEDKGRLRAWLLAVAVAMGGVLVLEALGSSERDTPDYITVDARHMAATFVRAPELAEVPYPVKMEPNLVVEFYAS